MAGPSAPAAGAKQTGTLTGWEGFVQATEACIREHDPAVELGAARAMRDASDALGQQPFDWAQLARGVSESCGIVMRSENIAYGYAGVVVGLALLNDARSEIPAALAPLQDKKRKCLAAVTETVTPLLGPDGPQTLDELLSHPTLNQAILRGAELASHCARGRAPDHNTTHVQEAAASFLFNAARLIHTDPRLPSLGGESPQTRAQKLHIDLRVDPQEDRRLGFLAPVVVDPLVKHYPDTPIAWIKPMIDAQCTLRETG